MSNATQTALSQFLAARLAEDEGVQQVVQTLPFPFDGSRLDERTQRRLAAHYSDHPDYRAEWA